MSSRTVDLDESDDPIAIGSLGSVGIMMTTQYLMNKVHRFSFSVWFEFELVFRFI